MNDQTPSGSVENVEPIRRPPGATVMIRRANPHQGYYRLSNAAAQDHRLSFLARGLLSYLLSLPPDWTTSIRRLADLSHEGRESLSRAVRELEHHGYLIRQQVKGQGGRFECPTWTVTDDPSPVVRHSGHRESDHHKEQMEKVRREEPLPSVEGSGTPSPRSARCRSRGQRSANRQTELLRRAVEKFADGDYDDLEALASPDEVSVVLGMLDDDRHPKAIANTLIARRKGKTTLPEAGDVA